VRIGEPWDDRGGGRDRGLRGGKIKRMSKKVVVFGGKLFKVVNVRFDKEVMRRTREMGDAAIADGY